MGTISIQDLIQLMRTGVGIIAIAQRIGGRQKLCSSASAAGDSLQLTTMKLTCSSIVPARAPASLGPEHGVRVWD